jgi:Ni/Co efflux regulator RcnB
MKKTLIALTAAAGFAAAGLALTPAAAAPAAPGQLGLAVELTGNNATQIRRDRHRHRHVHRHVHRHKHVHRRHFWAAGPWAFRGLPRHHCHPVRGGYVCYY